MRTLLLVIVFFLMSLPSIAQPSNEPSTPGFRFYVSPVAHISGVKGEAGLFEGMEFGWIVNDRWTIGLEGNQLETDITADRPGPAGSPFVYMWYGGVTAEYGFQPARRVRLAARALVGGGEAHWRETSDDRFFGNREKDADHTTSLVLEPGVRASFVLTNWLQATTGASYRYMGAGKSSALAQDDMRQFAGTIGLRVGRF
jgi:hypothetical protein